MARGRPGEYKPDYHPEQARKFALLGMTDKEIARSFGVTERTIYNWKKEHIHFLQAVNQGKEIADAEVVQAFYKRATGYEYPSEKIVTLSAGDGTSVVERVPITAVVLPDPGAALNWLKNRQPDLWRDKQQHDLTGEFTFTLNLTGDVGSEKEE